MGWGSQGSLGGLYPGRRSSRAGLRDLSARRKGDFGLGIHGGACQGRERADLDCAERGVRRMGAERPPGLRQAWQLTACGMRGKEVTGERAGVWCGGGGGDGTAGQAEKKPAETAGFEMLEGPHGWSEGKVNRRVCSQGGDWAT